mmetsp:Transcript_78638/g.156327  ORF Transcript_78638/g.156327 Transcript_78638/m.156327 type:complete len:126 (+) Transcript_78638:237-614(+)
MPAATEDMPAAENSPSTVMLEEAVEVVARVAVAEPKRKPTAGEAAAELGLDPVGRDDWVAYFANGTDKEKQELLIAATSFADRNGGTLISQTAELCAATRRRQSASHARAPTRCAASAAARIRRT